MKVVPDRRSLAFIVSLHDVSPASWPLYRDFIDWLDRRGGIRSSLLMVPDFHRRAPVRNNAAFCRALDERQRLGDELVLHGYTHTDEAPPPRFPREILRRRILTHEGEFAALDWEESTRRIQAGLALCREFGWRVEGFVPPGWMSNPHSERAINEGGFRYRTDNQALYALPEGHRFEMPTLVMSSRSAWRRRLFAALNRRRLNRYRDAAMIRLALHPVDLRHDSSKRFWISTIEQLHDTRRSLTKRQWLDELLDHAPLSIPWDTHRNADAGGHQ